MMSECVSQDSGVVTDELQCSSSSPPMDAIIGAMNGVTGVVAGVGGAVVSGVTHGVTGALSSVSSGVGGAVTGLSSSVGETVHQVSGRVARYLTQPPSSLPVDSTQTGSTSEDHHSSAATPRTLMDNGLSSTTAATPTPYELHDATHCFSRLVCSSASEEDNDSLLEEDLSVCRELGVTQDMLHGDKAAVSETLTTLESKVKRLILEAEPGSNRRRVLVHTLVALREHLLKVNDADAVANEMGGATIKGHLLLPNRGHRNSCDVCTHTIWDIITPAYQCSECRLHVHWSCRNDIRRICPATYFISTPVTSHFPQSPQHNLKPRSTNVSSPSDAPPPPQSSTAATHTSTAAPHCSATSSSSQSPSKSLSSSTSSNSTAGPSSVKKASTSVPHKVKSLESLAALSATAQHKAELKMISSNSSAGIPHLQATSLITKICPEVGLGRQDFRCAECEQLITNHNAWSEPRLCHYSGLYYCPACHWHNTSSLPGLIISNWDFTPRSVSRCSYQLLNYVRKKPLLSLYELNPQLFIFIQDLCEIRKMREHLLLMKQYLCSCRAATEAKLLKKLSSRQHFVDTFDLYSIQDLVDLHEGVLIPELQGVYNEYSTHIKEDCEVCQGRAHICLSCNDAEDVLFPFDADAVQCSVCFSVMHKHCYMINNSCARCIIQGREAQVSVVGATLGPHPPSILPPSPSSPSPVFGAAAANS